MLKHEQRNACTTWRMNDMQISRTDAKTIAKYLHDAALLYDRQKGQRNVCRAEMIRRQIAKINKKLCQEEKS